MKVDGIKRALKECIQKVITDMMHAYTGPGEIEVRNDYDTHIQITEPDGTQRRFTVSLTEDRDSPVRSIWLPCPCAGLDHECCCPGQPHKPVNDVIVTGEPAAGRAGKNIPGAWPPDSPEFMAQMVRLGRQGIQ